jgi:hypothetical protein
MIPAMSERVKHLLAILLFLTNWNLAGATNSIPALIIKSARDTNALTSVWSPWSCWWLMPATNATPIDNKQFQDRTGHSAADLAVSGETNKPSDQLHLGLGETNAGKDIGNTNSDVAARDVNVTEFGVRILSGRPIGHRNVEMGQPNLQPGQAAAQPGPNNTQIGGGNVQLGGPNVEPRLSNAGIGKPATGIGQPGGAIGQPKP